jgi:hypothetical protein
MMLTIPFIATTQGNIVEKELLQHPESRLDDIIQVSLPESYQYEDELTQRQRTN